MLREVAAIAVAWQERGSQSDYEFGVVEKIMALRWVPGKRAAWLLTLLLAVSAKVAALEVGDPAPDFELQGSDGQTYRLADFRGRQAVVLAWFPRAFTSGCTIECKSLAENGHLLREYDVSYFMASVDSLASNSKFAKETNADFPLLSDPDKVAARAYGVLNAMGFTSRHTIYIAIDGRVAAIDRDVRPATSAEDMAAKLGELGVARR